MAAAQAENTNWMNGVDNVLEFTEGHHVTIGGYDVNVGLLTQCFLSQKDVLIGKRDGVFSLLDLDNDVCGFVKVGNKQITLTVNNESKPRIIAFAFNRKGQSSVRILSTTPDNPTRIIQGDEDSLTLLAVIRRLCMTRISYDELHPVGDNDARIQDLRQAVEIIDDHVESVFLERYVGPAFLAVADQERVQIWPKSRRLRESFIFSPAKDKAPVRAKKRRTITIEGKKYKTLFLERDPEHRLLVITSAGDNKEVYLVLPMGNERYIYLPVRQNEDTENSLTIMRRAA